MTRTLAALAFALVFPLSAAQSEPKEPFTPGLGEIMTLQQMRHLKLWYAGQAGNWPLADYELDELKEGFDKLTAACNACHQSARHPFIVVQRPTGNPYTNQSFAPVRNAETKSHKH
jgi:hypothetical protein